MSDAQTTAVGRWLMRWGRKVLAPETFERTMLAAQADLAHDLARCADDRERKRVARGGRVMLVKVLVGAICHDRREHSRGLRWWLLGAPLLAVMVGLVGLPAGFGTPLIAQLAFLALALIFGVSLARTPRRALAHEAVAAGWIAAALMMLVPLVGVAAEGSTRWLSFGPLRVHAATLVMPFVALALSALVTRGRTWHALALATVAQAAVALTSDLGASLTFAAVTLAIGAFAAREVRLKVMLLLAVPTIGAVVVAGLRDPLLAASAQSEGVLAGLGAIHPLWSVLGLAALVVAIVAPLTSLTRGARSDRWSRALAVSLAVALTVPLVANLVLATPLPLIGYGGSAIVATYLWVGGVMSLERPLSGSGNSSAPSGWSPS